MRVGVNYALGAVGVGLIAAFGCGKENDLEVDPPFDGGDGGASDFDGTFDGSTEPCEQYCSADLHSFIDCKGNVIKKCPAGQGCTVEGACVPACEAVKANKGSIGCEFYVHHPETWRSLESCFAAFIVNTWDTPVTITGEAGGVGIDLSNYLYLPSGSGKAISYTPLPNGEIPPGKVAIAFLHEGTSADSVKCPKPPANWTAHPNWKPVPYETSKWGYMLKIISSAPIAAYDIYPYGGGHAGTTSATLLLPTSTWDRNYVVVTPRPAGWNTTNPAFTIVASENETEVTLLPPEAIVGGNGISPAPEDQPVTYTLNEGEILHFSQEKDLRGTIVSSTKPVGVWGEQTCIEIDRGFCDGAHQQIPPVPALGSEYVGVRYRNRVDGKEEHPPWRLVGVVENTELTWEPSIPPEAPTILKPGRAYSFRTNGPFVVRSQDSEHPFYLNAYMTGSAEEPGVPCETDPNCFENRGDPEFLNVVPAAQFLTRYVFFTDPTYPETNLVFVRAKAKDGTFKDVKLDCFGNLTGWQPVGTSGKYEYTRTDLSRFNFEPQGACDNGRHEVSSEAPFGLTIWGWGSKETGDRNTAGFTQFVSYAYPAGASVQPVNKVVIPTIPH